MYKVLIVGANFSNKGAQSMLFTTVDALKQVNEECDIYFATAGSYDESLYKFKRIYYNNTSVRIALSDKPFMYEVKAAAKDFAKLISGRRKNLWRFMDLNKLIPQIDLIIDISGFSLGDKLSVGIHEAYLDNIRMARKYNIPMILMPQSIGPFNFDEERKFLLKELDELLRYPDVIFVREKDGFNCLKENFALENIRLSTDLVLQSSGFNKSNVFTKKIEINLPDIKQDAVGIIPNQHCFRLGSTEEVLKQYNAIIHVLLNANKEVYIFRHSTDDLDCCKQIYKNFSGDSKVHLLDNDFSCVEYDEFVKKFQFIVCSRFHGVVHGYRNCIPAVILGWAVKYQELAELMNQKQYVFNITDNKIQPEVLETIVKTMIENYQNEASIIRNRLIDVQKDNCFKIIANYFQD